ncbi:hypothetical protein [Streptomyces sp. CBMA123]|uniref:hypothetical protein n=1 Tax=Streptomyces sp. CBMA123 TaxID=1896313 RepID=UPI001661C36C|nr:hypothetical protein [Streptomyces sp. CBMA123]
MGRQQRVEIELRLPKGYQERDPSVKVLPQLKPFGLPDRKAEPHPTVRPTPIRRTRNPGKGKAMKMIKAIVKKFKRDEDLANHAWILHVI